MLSLVIPSALPRKYWGQKRSGHLACPVEEIDNHLHATFRDTSRDRDLGPCRGLVAPPEPGTQFNSAEPTLREVEEVVKTARSSSAPGPSGVPYKVYKQCPQLLGRLWKIVKVIWRRGKVAVQWKYAEGVWTPKDEGSCNIEQFRIILLLSVESKTFFKIMSQHLTDFLSKNSYIDTSVQKGGVPGVPGCLEHTGVVTLLIREANESKGDLAVLWLDLANAYGSIPHKLVETAQARHHVPVKICNLIMDHYNNFSARVSSGQVTSFWHKLEKGIITGCTISVSLCIPLLRSGLPGKFNAWIYQHGVLPRILWPLLVYEVPTSTVEALEKSISQFLRKWLGLPSSLSSIALYGHSTKLHLPLSGLNEEYKVTRSREVMMNRDSSNAKVVAAGTLVKTGRKWQAQEAAARAEARLRHKTLVGTVATGRAGLGCFPSHVTIWPAVKRGAV